MRRKIPELHYRSSRICRVLGNPTAYETLKLLHRRKMHPSELAQKLGLSLQTISAVLRQLRQLDLVRYVTEQRGKRYFIKDETIIDVMKNIEHLVSRIRSKEY
ncbi:MAG: winged helix-turn-helix transcriptional regulator [candidate division WOR-3 bacterium]|nr:MAG: winged helix-turn-helix transcriptional regulator [candidate division WOR-3 bacterium]